MYPIVIVYQVRIIRILVHQISKTILEVKDGVWSAGLELTGIKLERDTLHWWRFTLSGFMEVHVEIILLHSGYLHSPYGHRYLEIRAATMLAPLAEKYITTYQFIVFMTMFMAKQNTWP